MQRRIHIGAGFLLMLSLFYFLDDNGMFTALALSAVIHELGHFLGIVFMGSKITGLRLELTGAAINYNNTKVSYLGEAVVAFLGPFFGLIFAFIAAAFSENHEDLLLISGMSFYLSLLNLLPARNLDGGRILVSLLSWLKNEYFAERVVIVSSCLTSFAMLVLGSYILIVTRGNFTFLMVGIWLLFDFARTSRKI